MPLNLDFSFSLEEIIFALLLAFILTWIIKHIISFKDFVKELPNEFGYSNDEIKKITEKCYTMFPVEKVLFKGETFLRGAKVRITTMQKRDFEGELVGTNNKNMVCIITKKCIIAHEISNIDNITLLDKPANAEK